uniref:Secretory carrier-associated membrane protein n=1 Tax=Anas zonorhyncha TaxID=75864 RepID=A0A8B9V7V0_9AVES
MGTRSQQPLRCGRGRAAEIGGGGKKRARRHVTPGPRGRVTCSLPPRPAPRRRRAPCGEARPEPHETSRGGPGAAGAGPGAAMAQRGGPAVLPDNPFQVRDGPVPPPGLASGPGTGPAPGASPRRASAAAATAELLKRQEELNRKAEELDRRERELQNAALGTRLNNWPPLPSFCPVKPCFYQDIPVEIPADFQKTVSTMYYLWMASTIALFLNFLSSLAWFCVDPSSGSGFGLSILWALLYTPCSFVCWYRPMYKAFRSDSSFNFFVFFFVFFAQNVMYVLQAIGIPNWGFSGWILSLIALRKNTAVAVMMILVSLFFTAVAVLGIIMLKKIHSLYRRTGASFQKAQEEFAAGVFSNQAVRTAAANAAAGAATNAFRAP